MSRRVRCHLCIVVLVLAAAAHSSLQAGSLLAFDGNNDRVMVPYDPVS